MGIQVEEGDQGRDVNTLSKTLWSPSLFSFSLSFFEDFPISQLIHVGRCSRWCVLRASAWFFLGDGDAVGWASIHGPLLGFVIAGLENTHGARFLSEPYLTVYCRFIHFL